MIKNILKKKEKTETDVVYGVTIIRMFTIIPRPAEILKDGADPLTIFGDGHFLMFIIGIILLYIYWFQSNKTMGNLIATDGKHSFLTIMQLLFLLLYFYSVGLDMATHSDVLALFMQSVTLALVGFSSVVSWIYATKHAGLISEAVSDKEIIEIRNSVLTEPLAALFTIPFAFIGPGWWNLAWLSVLFFGWFLKRRQK